MKQSLIAIFLCGVAVAACEADSSKAVRPESADAAVSADWDDREVASDLARDDAGLRVRADMEGGEVALKLPGGIEGKLKLPGGLDAGTDFDLGDIGRYPGARLTSVNVDAGRRDGAERGVVVLGFAAPGTQDQVLDWFAQRLTDRGRPPERRGRTLQGTTEDGDRLVIAMEDATGGEARGRITITKRGA